MNYTEMLFNRDERLVNLLNQADSKNLELIEEINKKEDEIDRLNNIINELEKWIEEHKQYQLISERYIVWEDKLVNKLKALKENNKDV